jgi:hypothetical protein
MSSQRKTRKSTARVAPVRPAVDLRARWLERVAKERVSASEVREIVRAMKRAQDDGSAWFVITDSYCGCVATAAALAGNFGALSFYTRNNARDVCSVCDGVDASLLCDPIPSYCIFCAAYLLCISWSGETPLGLWKRLEPIPTHAYDERELPSVGAEEHK